MRFGQIRNKIWNSKVAFFVFLLLFFCGNTLYAWSDSLILIDPDKIVGSVNPLVFGTNMIAYEPSTFEDRKEPYYGYSNYGAGIWDPVSKNVNPIVAALVKEAGVTILRFPGGCGGHNYNWKNTIGPLEGRPNFQYGLDEFMRTSEATGGESVITLSYFTGTAIDAADLVEYLNSPDDGSNPGGGVEWAKIRVRNGHPLPYHVRYYEFGNEVYHGNHRDIKKISGFEYGRKFIEYSQAMKRIDPQIKLGAVTVSPYSQPYFSDWNGKMLRIAGPYIDFLMEHTYDAEKKYFLKNKKADPVQAASIYRETLDNLTKVESYYKELSKTFEEATGKNIPIAVTEYNGNFIRESDHSYRHSLGTALFNAGLLMIFMRPESNILMANYWQFVNSYWGAVKNDSFKDGKNDYIKRPNFYIFKMFKEHFGRRLISVSAPDSLLAAASLSDDGNRAYLVVINKNMKDRVQADVLLKNRRITNPVQIWTLNGPSVDSTNETNPAAVNIEKSQIKAEIDRLDYQFPSHSLTAMEIVIQ